MKEENSETSRKLIKWFADRGLDVKIAIAEGPLDITSVEMDAIEKAAKKITAFPDAREISAEEWEEFKEFTNDPLANDPVLQSKFFPTPTTPPLTYGQLAQASAFQPAGKPGIKGLEKVLAESDWQKRRPQVMDTLDEVFAEVKRSLDKHGGFRSGHEGYAILLEEVDELWEEIKNDNSGGVEARTEAIQVAAMAVKYAVYIAGNSR